MHNFIGAPSLGAAHKCSFVAQACDVAGRTEVLSSLAGALQHAPRDSSLGSSAAVTCALDFSQGGDL